MQPHKAVNDFLGKFIKNLAAKFCLSAHSNDDPTEHHMMACYIAHVNNKNKDNNSSISSYYNGDEMTQEEARAGVKRELCSLRGTQLALRDESSPHSPQTLSNNV